MAKRFTDTTKYKKPFIRSLQAPYKLLWDYLYHDCDHSGIWIVDFDIAQIYIGLDAIVNKGDALKFFNMDEERIIEFDEGKKWFIPSFIEFQYGELSEKNRAHSSVIRNLEKHSLLEFFKKENKPLISPLQGAMDMDMDKEKDKDKEKEKGRIEKKIKSEKLEDELVIPFDNEVFRTQWSLYKVFRKQKHKFSFVNVESENRVLRQLDNISNNDQKTAIKIIQQSIDNGWKGLFELKTNTSKNNKTSFSINR